MATALVRGAFEYQGQKCSAASRYVPADLAKIRKSMKDMIASIEIGSPEDPGCYVNAVIGRNSFDKIGGFVDRAKKNKSNKLVAGGTRDDAKGYFVAPTVFECGDPEKGDDDAEIFGPVLSVYVYPELKWKEALKLADESTAYALTGSDFAREGRRVVLARPRRRSSTAAQLLPQRQAHRRRRQQPFGAARALRARTTRRALT